MSKIWVNNGTVQGMFLTYKNVGIYFMDLDIIHVTCKLCDFHFCFTQAGWKKVKQKGLRCVTHANPLLMQVPNNYKCRLQLDCPFFGSNNKNQFVPLNF